MSTSDSASDGDRDPIARLLDEVAETHHRVYRITDGTDADWASWYADWLLNLSELSEHAAARFAATWCTPSSKSTATTWRRRPTSRGRTTTPGGSARPLQRTRRPALSRGSPARSSPRVSEGGASLRPLGSLCPPVGVIRAGGTRKPWGTQKSRMARHDAAGGQTGFQGDGTLRPLCLCVPQWGLSALGDAETLGDSEIRPPNQARFQG